MERGLILTQGHLWRLQIVECDIPKAVPPIVTVVVNCCFTPKETQFTTGPNNLMSNGAGLGGDWSTAQSTIIVPVTGDTNKYYIFNNDGLPTSTGAGLHYSLIDMHQNAGLGAVTEPKALNLMANTSEHLTGCKHSNGTDFWVITTDYDSSRFYAFQVTPSGVQSPIISNVGFNQSAIGNIEINSTAKKIAIKVYNSNQYRRHLVDFDNSTGYLLKSSPFRKSNWL